MKNDNKIAPDVKNIGATTTEEMPSRAGLCIVTSITALTKQRYINDAGKLDTITAAHMTQGTALNQSVSTAHELANLIDSLNHNQAITWGQHTGATSKVNILSEKKYKQQGEPDNTLTRTNNHFLWGAGGGVLMLDCDDKRMTQDKFVKTINDIIPLDNIAHVWRPSASSYIYNGHEQLSGLTGQRLYIFIKDASDIPRAGKNLFDRLWLNGHGYYEISKAGSYLERAPIDQSVFQASRLDFVSGSECKPPLEQRRVATQAHDGAYLDSKLLLPELSAKELTELAAIKSKTKADYSEEAEGVRAEFSHHKAIDNLSKQGIDKPTDEQLEAAKDNVIRALNVSILTGEYLIQLANDEWVSVGEVLDDPSKYHGTLTKDPLEPDYDGNKTCGKLYLYGQRPILTSRAHGGTTYKLVRQPRRIEHVTGRTFDTTQRTLELMRVLPEYYDMGMQMVSVRNGRVKPFNEDLLEHELGGIAQYWQSRTTPQQGTYEKLIDPPSKVIKHIIAMQGGRELKPLNAVITAPVITADDHIVSRQGYDKKTGLYLDCSEHNMIVPEQVSTVDAVAAYHELMKPFNTFDFADDLSRSVALSAVITALLRPSLPIAPAFAFDAPKQGSGKTYFCECIGLLASGHTPTITPSIERNEDETRKTLLAMLMQGQQFIVWDNIMGAFNSGVFASMLTSSVFGGRPLGKSELIELPNRAMVLLTGNNISLVGELPRRVLTCRFDTGMENPTQAKRDLSAIGGLRPADYIRKNRFKLALAALTLVRGYLQSNLHSAGGAAKQQLSSYEEWDTVARQPVVWIAQHVSGLTDPKLAVDEVIGIDPEHEALNELLTEIYQWVGVRPFTARALYDHAEDKLRRPTNGKFDAGLHELLTELNNGNRLTGKAVGRVLTYRRDRVANGLKLERLAGNSKGHNYRVVKA